MQLSPGGNLIYLEELKKIIDENKHQKTNKDIRKKIYKKKIYKKKYNIKKN